MQDWEKIAVEEIGYTHPILPSLGSLGAGLIGTVIVNPFFGFCLLGGLGYWTWQRTMSAAKQDEAIREYSCYGISLGKKQFQEYVREFGIEKVRSELLWAEENDYQLNDTALEWLDEIENPQPVVDPIDTLTQPLPWEVVSPLVPQTRPTQIESQPLTQHRSSQIQPPTTAIDPSLSQNPILASVPQIATPTVISPSNGFLNNLIPKVQNSCFIGLPRSGKDYLASLIAEEAKLKFGVKIFLLDPKGSPKEHALWAGIADRIFHFNGFEISSEQHARKIREGFSEFRQELKQTDGKHRWILVYNEFTTSCLELKAAGDTFLTRELPKLIAMGDSLQMNLWVLAQAPHMNAGLDGSIMGLFNRFLIVEPETINTMRGWGKTQLMSGINLDRATDYIRKSEMRRAVYCSAIDDEWLSIPRLARKTPYFCRETEKWIGGEPSHLGDTSAVENIQIPTPAVPRQHPGNTPVVIEIAETVATVTLELQDTTSATPRQHPSPAPAVSENTQTIAPVRFEPPPIPSSQQNPRANDLDAAVMNYFLHPTTSKEPKQPSKIKDASSIRKFGDPESVRIYGDIDSQLARSLERLVQAKKLVSPMNGYWALEDWVEPVNLRQSTSVQLSLV
jgi:hypothetical protein